MRARRGDTLTFAIEYVDKDDLPVSIVGSKFYATLKASIDDSDDDAAAKTENVNHDDDVGGLSHVTFTDTQTHLLLGKYFLDVQEKDASGQITTLISTIVIFSKDVTRRKS